MSSTESQNGVPSGVPFGPYVLVRRIGVGGMAEIFAAKRPGAGGFEADVVIKRILPDLSKNREFVEMLRNEALAAGQLQHCNIVRVYDFSETQGHYYIAMEHITGCSLRQLLVTLANEDKRLEPELGTFVISEICAGLEYAHNHGVLHRDINPQNVMISTEGEVKLLDFGIAKTAHQSMRTQDGILKGTWAYMAPEHIDGEEVDARADVFSTGLVALEIFTGQQVFSAKSDLRTLENIRTAPLPPKISQDVIESEKMREVLRQALQRDPAIRLSSAGKMRTDLLVLLKPHHSDELSRRLAQLVQKSSQEVPCGDLQLGPQTEILLSNAPDTSPARPKKKGFRAWLWLPSLFFLALAAFWIRSSDVFHPKEPIPPPLPQKTLLRIVTTPGNAEIVIDQNFKGKTPLEITDLAPRVSHIIELSKPGYKTHFENISLSKGDRYVINATLQPLPPPVKEHRVGWLNINAWPWAQVRIDGKRLPGTTPYQRLKVPVGKHKVELIYPPLKKTITRTVDVSAEKTYVIVEDWNQP